MDLTPAAFAAQARLLTMLAVDSPTSVRLIQNAIAAALGAVCDAARVEQNQAEYERGIADGIDMENGMQKVRAEAAERERDQRAEEVRQLREALEQIAHPD